MTDTTNETARTTLPGEAIPLCGNNEIIAAWNRAFDAPMDVHQLAFACWIRDDYEDGRAALQARVQELERSLSIADALFHGAVDTVAKLEAQLEEAAGANKYLVRENAVLFDRAARRLVYSKQLEATLADLGWSEDDEGGDEDE